MSTASFGNDAERNRLAAAESAKARLKTQAVGANQHLGDLIPLYANERFLARLAAQDTKQPLVLKGGFLVRTWIPGDQRRATRDADLATASPMAAEEVREVMANAAKRQMDDGLKFAPDTIQVRPIREKAGQHGGVSVNVDGMFGTSPVRTKIDVGFSDVMVPKPETVHIPAMLSTMSPLSMSAYRPETVIAEKYETAVWYGMANIRAKDIYDLAVIPSHRQLDGSAMTAAIGATFAHRKTPLPEVGVPTPFSEQYFNDAKKREHWQGFLKNSTAGASLALADAAKRAWAVLEAPTRAAAARVPFEGTWDPGSQSWRR